MEYADKWLVCSDCNKQFLWDAGEQAWYKFKQFFNQPKRCKACRERKQNPRPPQNDLFARA